MANPVSSTQTNYAIETPQPAIRQPQAQPQQRNALPKDTVQLKSTGGADHDGDKT
jgi:hypothetical protein